MHRRPALPAPDFLRPQRRPGPLPALWAATGLLVLAVAAGDAHEAWKARAAALDGAAAAAARPTGAARPGSGRPAAASAGPAGRQSAAATTSPQDAVQREAVLWRQRLAYPWDQVLAAADAAGVDGVAWLGLAHEQGGELRLDGQAERAEVALAAARTLRAGPPPGRWPEVQLARLDALPAGLRFELLALPAAAEPGPARPVSTPVGGLR